MKKRVILIFTLFVGILICLTGCGDSEPPTRFEVNEKLASLYGDSYEVISTEQITEESPDKSDITVYRLKSEFGFEFEMETGLKYKDAIGGYSKYYYDNYKQKISPMIEKKVKSAAVRLGMNKDDVTISEILDIYINVYEYEDMSVINELLYEIYNIYSREFKLKDEAVKYLTIALEKDGVRAFSKKKLDEINKSGKNENLKYLEELYSSKYGL